MIAESLENEKSLELLELAGLETKDASIPLRVLDTSNTRYLRDLKLNLKKVPEAGNLKIKEANLIALCVATKLKNDKLIVHYVNAGTSSGLRHDEMAEAIACASLQSGRNVLAMFRQYSGKSIYDELPTKLRKNIMMDPENGTEFYELMTLVVAAIDGCERSVSSCEKALIELGTTPERIYDAVRIASIVTSADKIVR